MLKHAHTPAVIVCIVAHLVTMGGLGFYSLQAFLSGNLEAGFLALAGLFGWVGSIIFWLAAMMAIHCLKESGIQPWVAVE